MTDWVLDLPRRTERLGLREHHADDLDDLLVFHGDPQVTRYTPWPVRDREQTREALDVRIPRTRAAGAGDVISLAVVERATGTVIGEALLKRGSGSEAEVGYAIRTDRWGRGLAAEAVGRLLEAATGLGVRKVHAVVARGNDASVRLLTRLGFAELAGADSVGADATGADSSVADATGDGAARAGATGADHADDGPTRTFLLVLG